MKITEIIENNITMDPDDEENDDSEDCPEEWLKPFEPVDSSEDILPENMAPRSNRSKNSRGSRQGSKKLFGQFRCFGSKNDVIKPSKTISETDLSVSSSLDQKEDSMRMFGRLRRQLSERQAEEWKEQETSWRKNDHVETLEEKWWNKINHAKKENVLFDKNSIAMIDSTTTAGIDMLDSTARAVKGGVDCRDSTRYVPGTGTGTTTSNSVDTSSTAETEKKKKTSTPKKKKSIKEVPDSEINLDKKKKKKNEKKTTENEKKTTENVNTPSIVTDVEEQKSPKLKKKKKKSKAVDSDDDLNSNDGNSTKSKQKSIMAKKKRGKSPKERSKNGRKFNFPDDSDSKSIKKKSNKDNSIELLSSTKKKKGKTDPPVKDTTSVKLSKKKKKKGQSSTGSRTEDAVQCDNQSMDWTDRCIRSSPSDATTNGSLTVVTLESR